MEKALIIIDLQNGFITESSKRVIPKIKSLIESNKFKHILFTKFINQKDGPFFKILNWERVISPPETQIVDELKPFAKNIFIKHLYSSFTEEFNNYLKKHNISDLYIIGIDTECCVFKTAVDAFEKGYKPFILSEYCASHESEEYHTLGIKLLKRLLGKNQILSNLP